MTIVPSHLGRIGVVGLGNIGSHVGDLLSRTPPMPELTLVDHDSYESKNMVSQNISPADVGRKKALVQKERANVIDPGRRVTAYATRIENVPLGALRDRVLIGCLDSLSARQALSQRAWWGNSIYFDTGINVSANLVRITMYVPGDDAACLECLWDHRQYGDLDNLYTCQQATTRPTEAPARLGALVAALVVGEFERLCSDLGNPTLMNREMIFDAASRECHTTRLTQQSTCLFSHRTLEIEKVHEDPNEMTLGDAFCLGSGHRMSGKTLGVPGIPWVIRGLCQWCQRTHAALALAGREEEPLCCPDCQRPYDRNGLQLAETVDAADLSSAYTDLPLSRVGVQWSDVFAVRSNGLEDQHFELSCSTPCSAHSQTQSSYHLHV